MCCTGVISWTNYSLSGRILALFGSRKLQILLLSNFPWSDKARSFSDCFFFFHTINPIAFSYHQMVLRRQKSILAEATWGFFCLVTQKIYSFRIWETERALGKFLLRFVTVPILQPDFKFQGWSQNETTRIKWFLPIWHHLSKKFEKPDKEMMVKISAIVRMISCYNIKFGFCYCFFLLFKYVKFLVLRLLYV